MSPPVSHVFVFYTLCTPEMPLIDGREGRHGMIADWDFGVQPRSSALLTEAIYAIPREPAESRDTHARNRNRVTARC